MKNEIKMKLVCACYNPTRNHAQFTKIEFFSIKRVLYCLILNSYSLPAFFIRRLTVNKLCFFFSIK